MAWKTEKWMADVFPGESGIWEDYRLLPPRELSIVSVAVLDSAISEILSLRLAKFDSEIESFLGVNGDGRAPVSSFGARIQLALLLGLIDPEDAAALRGLKQLRNMFAHRVKIDMLSKDIVKVNKVLFANLSKRVERMLITPRRKAFVEKVNTVGKTLHVDPKAGEFLITVALALYQSYFYSIHPHIRRVEFNLPPLSPIERNQGEEV